LRRFVVHGHHQASCTRNNFTFSFPQVLVDLLQKLHSFYVAAPVDDPLAAIFDFKF